MRFGTAEGPWRCGDGRMTDGSCARSQDDGPGIADPLAGYLPPADAMEAGRGLWLARQLVDLLQIVPNSTETTVRLHVDRYGHPQA